MSALVAGLAFGLLGSGHCAVMCGPLASLTAARQWPAGYHAGRLLTYLLLGLVAGGIGTGASVTGTGRLLAIASGMWLLVLAVRHARPPARPAIGPTAVTTLLARVARECGHRPRAASWIFGAANALLPCGLVYAAAMAAAGFGTLRDALLFLGAFGLGTVPLLAVAGAAGPALARRMPVSRRVASTLALVVVGALLIARGVAAPGPGAESHVSAAGFPAHH